MRNKIGIDPGLAGAIAILNDNDIMVCVFDMPIMAGTGKRQQVNAAQLAKMLRNSSGDLKYGGEGLVTAYLERASAMPRQGVSSMFSFGCSYGIIIGVLSTLRIPTVIVSPRTWKKKAGLIGKEKDAARALAQQLYPDAELGRKRDIGRADALLIARFGDA